MCAAQSVAVLDKLLDIYCCCPECPWSAAMWLALCPTANHNYCKSYGPYRTCKPPPTPPWAPTPPGMVFRPPPLPPGRRLPPPWVAWLIAPADALEWQCWSRLMTAASGSSSVMPYQAGRAACHLCVRQEQQWHHPLRPRWDNCC